MKKYCYDLFPYIAIGLPINIRSGKPPLHRIPPLLFSFGYKVVSNRFSLFIRMLMPKPAKTRIEKFDKTRNGGKLEGVRINKWLEGISTHL